MKTLPFTSLVSLQMRLGRVLCVVGMGAVKATHSLVSSKTVGNPWNYSILVQI